MGNILQWIISGGPGTALNFAKKQRQFFFCFIVSYTDMRIILIGTMFDSLGSFQSIHEMDLILG